MQIGTAWDPSLVPNKPRKRVSFDEANLAHLRQNKGQQQHFQLRQLGSKTEKQELPAQNNTMTTANLAGLASSKPTCSNSLQQHGRRSFNMRNVQTTAYIEKKEP